MYLMIFAVTTKFLYVIYLLIPMIIIFNQCNIREIIKHSFLNAPKFNSENNINKNVIRKIKRYKLKRFFEKKSYR